MNVFEEMMMRALTEAVRTGSEPLSAEGACATQEVINGLGVLEASRVHGVLVLAVSEEAPNADGEPGISLYANMAGSPLVLQSLMRTGEIMLRMTELQEQSKKHPLGALLADVMSGQVMQSELAKERFSSEGKSKQ